MARHFTRLFIETALAFILLVGLGTILLVSRLDNGPIDLTPLASEIESVLGTMAKGLSFDVNKAELRKGTENEAIQIYLDGVTVQNKESETIGGLAAIRLGYAWRNLFTLTVIPHSLMIDSPSVRMTRFEDGHIGFNLQDKKDETKKGADIPELAHLLARAPEALQDIRIQDAWITFLDKKDNNELVMSKGLFAISRLENEIAGTMSMHVAAKDFEQDIKGTIKYDPKLDVTAFSVGMKNFKPDSILAMFSEVPAELKVAMPLDIMTTLSIDAAFQPVSVDVKLMAKKGSVEYQPYITKEIPLSDFLAIAHYTPKDGALNIEQLSFGLLEKAHASLTVTRAFAVREDKKFSALEVGGVLKDFPLNDLKYVWPHSMATNAQVWVTNQISNGVANEATINVKAEMDADKNLTIQSLGGTIDFTGLTVDYLAPMPKVNNTNGHAEFGVDNFDIDLSAGEVFDTKLKQGKVKITGLSKEDQDIDITLKLDGPVKDAITVIASQPLEFPQSMGLSPGQFSGNAKTDIWLNFPLRKDLTTKHVQMKTDATLDNLIVTNIVKDLTISGSGLILKADPTMMSLNGKAKLADADVDLTWQETFDDAAEQPTVITVDGQITPAVIKGLRLPVEGYFTGSANAQVHINSDSKKNTHVKASANLANAAITIPEFSATKNTGVAGKLNLNVLVADNGATDISDLNASWDGFDIAAGDARWNAAQDLESATLKGLHAGRMKADITVVPTKNGIDLSMTGDTLDISGYWTRKPDPNAPPEKPDTREMNIKLRGKTVFLDPEKPLTNMEADLRFVGDDLVTGRLAANVDKGELLMKQTVRPNGIRDLVLTMKNAGRVFEALDVTDSVQGGIFDLRGQSSPEKPKSVTARMIMRDFTLVKAPVLARLINAFSLAGLGELLNGQGLYFGKMQSTVMLESPKTIRLKDGKMAGASLGLSFAGRVYRDKGTISLKGNLVPIEGINKAVGRIPLIGQILTGLKGEGMIAAAYTIKGPTDNPNVMVNPLSVFTPGILRSIFFESDSD